MAALRTTSIFLIEMILFFGAYYFGKLKNSINGRGSRGGESGRRICMQIFLHSE